MKAGGATERGRFLVLNVLRTGEAAPWRCGFITGKKTGGAVERNRVRRRLREIVRGLGPRLAEGCWLVTISRWNAARASYEELEQDWMRAARRAGILREQSHDEKA